MSGAVSFVLGLLGFGAAGGVSAAQGVSQRKKEAEQAEIYGDNNVDAETRKMRKRVEEEWWQICSWSHQLSWRVLVYSRKPYEYRYDAQEMVSTAFGG